MPDLDDELIEVLRAFLAETEDLLEQMDQSLLALEDNPDDRETLNALFRVAHTVKGTAGMFGMDAVVAFAHRMESVLDRLREGRLVLDVALGSLLFRSRDMLAALLGHAAGVHGLADPIPEPDAGALSTELDHCLSGLRPAGVLVREAEPTSTAVQPDDDAGTVSQGIGALVPPAAQWQLHMRFLPQTFRNGFDPLSVIDFLRSLGDIRSIEVDGGVVPDLRSLDPLDCHLSFRVGLTGPASVDEIADAVGFFDSDCVVEIAAVRPAGSAAHDAPARSADGPVGTPLKDPDLPEQRAIPEAATSSDAAPLAPATQRAGSEAGRHLRVPAEKLDQLINLVGELVIASASAGLLARHAGQAALTEANQHVSRLVEDIRNSSLSLRMVQIGETFTRFRRVVRDVAGELGKEVRLECSGTDTELDKSVVERIGDPLMHLVRNALDHGIEQPDDREAAGKPRGGTLHLSAHHSSGHIVIQVTDDGRGLDLARIRAKAVERHLIAPEATLSDAEVCNLIFEPGFSTAAAVTNLSGRGVGMDVVRRNIESLRGTVVIHNRPGQGTTVEIRLPLTLAIIDGFLVKSGDTHFVIPLDLVVECIDGTRGRLSGSRGGSGHLDLRGAALPFIDLNQLYATGGTVGGRQAVIVVAADDDQVGLMVDELVGEYQTVIKPLGPLFRRVVGIGGSTILGSGEVALILDVPALVGMVRRQADGGQPAARAGASEAMKEVA